jgi:general secretion pathway protein A
MFASFYQLQEQPFGVNPDPRYLYLSKTHREVFSSLLYRIQTDCGFLAMIAQPGMGKTTLLFHLLNQLQATARTAFVFQTQCNSNDFMRYLLSEFGCSANTTDPVRMFQELKTILVAEANAGRRCIVLIDEAQNLQAEVLETIRLLSDFETPRRKLLQIILSGQLELEAKLTDPGLSQLRQRLSSIARLQRFGTEDTVLYIAHRLRVAGHKEAVTSLFDEPALARIVILSGGIPRVINNVCFNALSLGFAIGARQIDSSIIEEVACDLGIDKALTPTSISLCEIECMLPVVSHLPEKLSESEDRLTQEVYAAVSPQPEAAQSPATVGASGGGDSNPLSVGGPETRTAQAGAQPETTAAPYAQARVTPAEQEQNLKEKTAKKAAPAPTLPVQVATKPYAARVRIKTSRSRDRFTAPTVGKLVVVRGAGLAAASALLLGICLFAPVDRRGAGRSVQAKSTVRMPTPLRNPESLPAAVTAPLELARAHGSSIDVSASPLGETTAKAKALTPVGSNERLPPAVRASNVEERLLALSQPRLPDNLLQAQTVMPAALSFTITDSPAARVSPAIHSLTLPTLKDAPPALLISAPATRIVGSSKSSYVPPRAISRPSPVYPDFAKSARLQGDVTLSLSISRTGEVQNAMVLSGNTLLASAAENAALHWSYAPGLSNGVPVESQMQVVVRFRLQ